MVLAQTGQQRLESGDVAGGLSALRDAAAERGAFAETHLRLGRAILETGGDPSEAIRELKAAANLDPESADAHYLIALASLKSGDRPQARAELQAAAAMAPCRVEIMRALEEVCRDLGDQEAADRLFRRILAWDPNAVSLRERSARDRPPRP
jgi:Tfp pilus assembly protein PilF